MCVCACVCACTPVCVRVNVFSWFMRLKIELSSHWAETDIFRHRREFRPRTQRSGVSKVKESGSRKPRLRTFQIEPQYASKHYPGSTLVIQGRGNSNRSTVHGAVSGFEEDTFADGASVGWSSGEARRGDALTNVVYLCFSFLFIYKPGD